MKYTKIWTEIGDPSDDTVLMMVWNDEPIVWFEDRFENVYEVVLDIDFRSTQHAA